MDDDILPSEPPKRTYDPNQDAVFVTAYVETGDPIIAITRAQIQDPSASIIVTAQHYMGRPEIQAAIAVVQGLERQSAPIKVTRESMVESLQAVFESAYRDRQYGSAIQAIKTQAGLLGLLEQKIAISHSYKVEDMSNEELARLAAGYAIEGKSQVIDVEDA